MTLREKLLLGGIAAAAAIGAMLLASPDADAEPWFPFELFKEPVCLDDDALCAPVPDPPAPWCVVIQPCAPVSGPTTWQDLLLPEELR